MAEAAAERARVTSRAHPVLFVVLCGAVGGLVYWTSQRVVGIHPFNLRWYAAVPASLLFGAVAGFLGVYLIANSDTSDKELRHTLAFALICGVCWNPVIEAGKQTVNAAIGASDARSAEKQVDTLQQTLKSNNTAGVKQAISTIVQTTSQAIQKLPDIHDAEVKKNIQDASQATAKTLAQAAREHPDASIAGLEELGKAAAANKDFTLVKSVAESLSEVQSVNPAASVQASQARESVLKAAGLPAASVGSGPH